MKLTIIINGAGGAGKDTLCEVASLNYKTMIISAIDPIKQAASCLGWNGKKDLESRKFLSDLKQLSIEYNDWPTRYLIKRHKEFINSDYELLFIHIREGSEISHFKECAENSVVTLLIRRKQNDVIFGNKSDDDVEKYSYDYVYDNDYSLEDTGKEFISLLSKIIEKECHD